MYLLLTCLNLSFTGLGSADRIVHLDESDFKFEP